MVVCALFGPSNYTHALLYEQDSGPRCRGTREALLSSDHIRGKPIGASTRDGGNMAIEAGVITHRSSKLYHAS